MRRAVLVATVLSLSACAMPQKKEPPKPHNLDYTQMEVIIDAIADKGEAGKKFVIQSGMKDVKETDLRFKEVSAFTQNALVLRGYSVAENAAAADTVILLSYKVSDSGIANEPYFHPTGSNLAPAYAMLQSKSHVIEYNTFETTPTKGRRNSTPAAAPGAPAQAAPAGSPLASFLGAVKNGGRAPASSTTAAAAAPGGADGLAVDSMDSSGGGLDGGKFWHSLVIQAYDGKSLKNAGTTVDDEARAGAMKWETRIMSVDAGSDARDHFPLMLASGMKYLGANTGHRLTVEATIMNNGAKLCAIRGLKTCDANSFKDRDTVTVN